MSGRENTSSSSSSSEDESEVEGKVSQSDTSSGDSSDKELDEASRITLRHVAKHPNEKDVKVESTQVFHFIFWFDF